MTSKRNYKKTKKTKDNKLQIDTLTTLETQNYKELHIYTETQTTTKTTRKLQKGQQIN